MLLLHRNWKHDSYIDITASKLAHYHMIKSPLTLQHNLKQETHHCSDSATCHLNNKAILSTQAKRSIQETVMSESTEDQMYKNQ